MPAKRLVAVTATVVLLVALDSWTEPHGRLNFPPDARMPVATPSMAPATTHDCERYRGRGCDEWTPLRPQPSFRNFMRLMTGPPAPGGFSWAGLFLCGAIPDELLERYLGGGFIKVIAYAEICAIESTDRDHSRSVDVFLGDASLDVFARSVFAGASTKQRTTIHGRDALTYQREPDGYAADHHYILSIPSAPDHVFVVKVAFTRTYDDNDEPIEPDRDAAQRFVDEVARVLIDLSK